MGVAVAVQLAVAVDRFGEWEREIGQWTAWLASGAARPSTLNLRRSQLRRFARRHRDLGPFGVGPAQVADWIGGHGWSRETIRSHRAALRSFYAWAQDSGISVDNPARLLRKVPAAPVLPRPADDGVIAAAIDAADARLTIMLLLGSRQGLRRGEISRVHSRDITPDLVGWSLRVHGKGGKQRDVPLHESVAARLRALPAGYAFPSPRGGHLTEAHVGKLIRRALSAAAGGRVTAHQLRHRYATVTYRCTGDLVAVQRLLGHASPATTIRYVDTDSARLRAVSAAAA